METGHIGFIGCIYWLDLWVLEIHDGLKMISLFLYSSGEFISLIVDFVDFVIWSLDDEISCLFKASKIGLLGLRSSFI